MWSLCLSFPPIVECFIMVYDTQNMMLFYHRMICYIIPIVFMPFLPQKDLFYHTNCVYQQHIL